MPCQLLRIALHGRCHHHHYREFGTPPDEAERSALLLYFFSSLIGAVMSVVSKLAGAEGIHFFVLVAARSSILCLLLIPVLIRHRVNPFAITETFPLLLLRGFLGFSSLSLWIVSMNLLPLSDANALSFVSPVAVAVLAPILLREPTPKAVYVSLPACMVGMLMVAQPTWLFGAAAGATSTLGVLAGILQALLGAGSKLTIRALNRHHEPLESILFSMGFISTVGATLGCLVLPGEQLAPPQQSAGWIYLAAASILALAVQATFTASLRKCNPAKAASLDYLSLLWTLLADGLVFHKLPNNLSQAGAGVITAASLGSILWSMRAPAAGQAGEGAAAAAPAPAEPQQYKQEHYLPERCSPGRSGGGKRSSAAAAAAALLCAGSSEEAVSLLKAAAAAGADWSEGEEEVPAAELKAKAAGGSSVRGQAVAAGAAARAPDGSDASSASKQAAKLALVGWLTDSSKSWRLGTELEAAIAAGSGGTCMDGRPTEAAAGGRAGSEGLELQGVSTVAAPLGMRTSTEKEQALAAAGK